MPEDLRQVQVQDKCAIHWLLTENTCYKQEET